MNISNASGMFEKDQKRDMPILGNAKTLGGALRKTVLLKKKKKSSSGVHLCHSYHGNTDYSFFGGYNEGQGGSSNLGMGFQKM